MIGLDRFAIEINESLYSRLDQGGSMLVLFCKQPDMKEVAPALYEAELELFSESPGLYMKHPSLEEYSSAPDDNLFLVRRDNLYVMEEDGSLVVIDNEFLAKERQKFGIKGEKR